MQTISLSLGNRSYPIWIESGIHQRLNELLKSMNTNQKWVIITHPTLKSLFGKIILNNLKKSGFDIDMIEIPEGEKSKCLNQINIIFSKLLSMECDRSTMLIALGGGVIGDITGFVASTFMRGISYIQLPTTLLAMVDSSIGGKTGINLDQGKNLVGTIWQPKVVITDPNCLSSLPKRELTSALGEIMKYGFILDKSLLKYINKNIDPLLNLDIKIVSEIISRCSKLKADLVSQDENDGNIRSILNFGHTIGHALEKYFGYNILRHGEAISYGMVVAGKLSVKKSMLQCKEYRLLERSIKNLSLPKLPNFDPDEIWHIMKMDKKIKNKKINFILIKEIGQTIIYNDINKNDVIEALTEIKKH